jgi:ATP-dependent helicase/nuclease subunit A
LIACPLEWARFEEAERDFLEAENERLLYVAATRSGTCLVVSGRDKRPGDNPWRSLVEDLAGQKQHEDPGPQIAPSRSRVGVELADVEDAVSEINNRWLVVRNATYRVEAVKAAALGQASSRTDLQLGATSSGAKPVDVEPAEPTRQAERGVAWGQDMHKLLDVAMRRRDRDLESLARSLAQEGELEEHDEDWVQQLVKTAHKVRQSEIWKRALSSKRVFAEIPFTMLAESDDAAAMPAVQTLRRGAIDLAFFEGGGWVIVDYKTDRVTESSVGDKVEYYRPQVQGYAEAWASLVHEPVIESGLYFTSLDRYRRL